MRADEFLTEVKLSRSELNKRNNWDVLYQMIVAGKPLKLAGQDQGVVIQADPELLDQISKKQIPDLLPLADGGSIRLTQLDKTPEFGGRGEGSGTAHEDWALEHLNNQVSKLLDGQAEMPIVVGDREVMVAQFVSVPKTPKADWAAVDAQGNEVAWISHKKGETPKDFNQWGGMTDTEFREVFEQYPQIHEEVVDFVNTVRKLVDEKYEGQMPNKTTWARKIKNGRLRAFAIYGNEFGGQRGRQNVDLVLQGNPTIRSGKLVATHTHTNGDRVEKDFEPVLMVMYKGLSRKDFGIIGARFGIQPLGGRVVRAMI